MTAPELTSRHWLASYEANVKGWLATVGGGDHVATHPVFSILKSGGVHFYDPAHALAKSKPGVLPLPGGAVANFYA